MEMLASPREPLEPPLVSLSQVGGLARPEIAVVMGVLMVGFKVVAIAHERG
jgi:hypothetical protein